MVGNLEKKRNLYFIFSAPSLSKNCFHAAEWDYCLFIDASNKFSIFQKKCNIALSIMCFIMNVIIAKQIFSAHLIYPF